MRRSDIITIALVAVIGLFCTYFLGQAIIGDPNEATASVKVIEPITVDLVNPDSEVFNENAINPTVEVYVGVCKDLDQNGHIDDAEQANCNNENSANPDEGGGEEVPVEGE